MARSVVDRANTTRRTTTRGPSRQARARAVAFSGLNPSGATKNGRIDYILYSKKATNLVVLGSQVYDTRDSHGVMPSDHRPVLTTFEVR